MITYAPTPLVSRLTGLSTETLREWTSRRALIPADVRPRKKGSPAQYSWQTVLMLRLAVALRNQFHVELQAQKPLFDDLCAALRHRSFLSLWGRSLLISAGTWSLTDGGLLDLPNSDAILIRLNPHLDVISAGFALPDPRAVPGQLDLFPVQIAARRPASSAPADDADAIPAIKKRTA